jgi:hypothetical protein
MINDLCKEILTPLIKYQPANFPHFSDRVRLLPVLLGTTGFQEHAKCG